MELWKNPKLEISNKNKTILTDWIEWDSFPDIKNSTKLALSNLKNEQKGSNEVILTKIADKVYAKTNIDYEIIINKLNLMNESEIDQMDIDIWNMDNDTFINTYFSEHW